MPANKQGRGFSKNRVQKRMNRVSKVGITTEDKYETVAGEVIISEDGTETQGEPVTKLVSAGKEIDGKVQRGEAKIMALINHGIKLNSRNEENKDGI